ncbi:hypothetical protein [Pilimelia columellifera]|uniref:hypothetical protein n=1 Tax=Pilimelia columellifera TaxID=706574 RepID=UPI0031E0217A
MDATAGVEPTQPPRVNNFGDTRVGGLAGPLGALFVVLVAIVTVLLIRNMNTRLRRLPREFPTDAAGVVPRQGSGEPPATAGR